MQNGILKKQDVTYKFLFAFVIYIFCSLNVNAQFATSTTPVSIGRPCGSGAGITDSIMYFSYNSSPSTISRIFSCRPTLASPGISSSASSVSFNPADGNLYVAYYKTSGGVASYVWRWAPGTCPAVTLPVYKTYPNQMIAGLEFDASGVGYQINFTSSYGIELQKFDVATNTFGPSLNIDLQGKKVYTQNGDFVITPTGQFLMVWDNKYFSLNYQDYNTSTPLVATYIDTLKLSGGGKMVGLSYAQGNLIGSATGGCSYYSFNILTGALTPIAKASGVQFATDMTNISSGLGAAKQLVSATPVKNGVYDLVYYITVKNFGDYPVTNLQVAEDLTTIHPSGASKISNVSAQMISNPAGIVLNPLFNGVTDKNLVLSLLPQTLPNYPIANSSCVIRVKFRLSGVVTGTTYYNSAVVTGNGYSSIALKDSSTNGAEPDLNSNNKPDDVGEGQPTPFVVTTAAEFPPCSSISNVLYTQDFGTGSIISTTLPGTVATEYTAGTSPMNEESYILTNNANNGNTSKYVNLADHTRSNNGRMLLVNGDVQNYKIFEDVVNITCVNVKYSFLVYAANVTNSSYNTFCNAFGGTIYPKFTFVVRNASNNSIITNFTTDDIPDSTWKAYGLKWVMPKGIQTVKIQIYNSAEGGCGNAFAIDDVQFGVCDLLPAASASSSGGCLGLDASFNLYMSDTTSMGDVFDYEWQSSSDGSSNWKKAYDKANFTIKEFATKDVMFYRSLVKIKDNSSSACQFYTNKVYLPAKDSSTRPTSALSDKAFLCPGQSAVVSVSGGSLGYNAVWKWYKTSCGGDYENTGSSATVYPTGVGTTYYVRAEGDCNVTNCVLVNVPLTCVLAEEAINLKGAVTSQQTNLSWTIVSDARLNFMEVERSIDGIHFQTIQKMAINGFANKTGYSTQDNIETISGNTVFYRIKVTRADAQVQYSKVLSLPIKTTTFKATVSPNPATTKAEVKFYARASSEVAIKLFNAQGQLLQSAVVAAESGYNTYTIPHVYKLKGGMYFISISDASGTSHLKLIVQ
jgi:hypothetical protein